jgi:hypothetical protein
MGADEMGDSESSHARFAEAQHWAFRASESLEDHAQAARLLAVTLRREEQEHRRWRLRSRRRVEPVLTTFEELFDDPTLALLYRSGTGIERLRHPVRATLLSSTPVISFSMLLEQSAGESEEYSGVLRESREPEAPWLDQPEG